MSSQGKPSAAKPQSPDSVMKGRFYSVVLQCVEKKTPVTVTMGTGEVYTGSLHALVKEGVVIHNCKKSGSEEVCGEQKLWDFQTLEFEMGDDRTQPVKFKRDGEITRAKAPGRRELQKYSPETPVQHTLGDPSTQGKFDQFETNRKLFGVTATFNEDQYTTPLVKPEELTPAQIKRTEKVIKALMMTQTFDDAGGEAEEEERFAAVKGTGRFKPEADDKHPSCPVLTNSSGDLSSFHFEKPSVMSEKHLQNPPTMKNYRQIRVDLVRGKKIHPGLMDNPERIDALQLEVATFRNDVVVDDLIRFKEERERERVKKVVEELKSFKEAFDKRPKIEGNGKKEDQREGLGAIVEEIPASLMDVFLESLGEQESLFEPVDPYWPTPPEHRALTVPPSHDLPLSSNLALNPDAPAFEFPLPIA